MNEIASIIRDVSKAFLSLFPFAIFIKFMLLIKSLSINDLLAYAVFTILITIYCLTMIIIIVLDEREDKK